MAEGQGQEKNRLLTTLQKLKPLLVQLLQAIETI